MQDIAVPFVCFRNYMNDSFRTDVFVRFSPETIACACIYLAARKLQISLPNSPPWWLLMGADEAEMQRISKTILSLYNRKKPNLEELEAIVNNLKKQQNDAKLKAKEIKQAIDGTNTSNASPEESNHPSPVIMSGKKDEYQDRPTLTLGEELSRLCKKKAEMRLKTSEDQKNDKYSDVPEKTGSRNHSRGERVHDHKLNEKRYSDSETRKDKYRNDKHSYKSDNVIRSDENEKGRANGLDRLIQEKLEYEYTDKYSHHKEKSKKRRRERSPSPISYQESKVARDGRHKYSYSRTPSPGAYKESRHSRDYKYKHSKHSSRY